LQGLGVQGDELVELNILDAEGLDEICEDALKIEEG
jgi:hypothetical protein